MSESLFEAFEIQSQACAKLGSDFSAAMLGHAAKDIAAAGDTARILQAWAQVPVDQLVRDAVALRFLASLHALVLGDRSAAMAACYPPHAPDPDGAWAAARSALTAQSDFVAAMLAHEPQTNEVRRSACLLGGFLTVAAETGLPLRCFELGASAGLNSLWDQYRYEIGGKVWGNPESPVVLPCRWDGAAPSLDSDVIVAERHACDRRPVDFRQPAEALRLLSYCWADQHERMERLRAAIALAQRQPLEVEAQPASAWVVKAAPKCGAATVVFHSIVWQYMPPAEQAVAMAHLQAHCARASRQAPFFWLRMEWNEPVRQFELLLRAWDKPDDRLLATVHPHGEFASWL